MDKGVKLKLSHERLGLLYQLYVLCINQYPAESTHEELLSMHMKYLMKRMRLLLVREQEKYTFNLNGMEALAFKQYWETLGVSLPLYQGEIIRASVSEIDKYLILHHDTKTFAKKLSNQ